MRVTGEDWARLGEDAERAAHFIGSRAYLKMQDGRCASLAIRAATDGSGAPEYFCSIYERRPRVCRELGRGSPECEAERELKGGRPAEAAGDATATEPRAA